jgi:hypothetical protein
MWQFLNGTHIKSTHTHKGPDHTHAYIKPPENLFWAYSISGKTVDIRNPES